MQIISHGAYGVNWPENTSKFHAELFLYLHDEIRDDTPKAEEKHVHFTNAIKAVFPPAQLAWHKWLERAVEEWCYTPILSEWGASSMGKSSDYGVIALVDALADPANTLSVFITNPLKMHNERCYKYVMAYHSRLPKSFQLLSERKADPKGMLFDWEKANRALEKQGVPHDKLYANQQSGIVCHSTNPGDTAEDMKKRIGSHLPRMRLIVDEAPACNDVVLNLIANMTGGAGVEFKERALGNPSLKGDVLSRHSEPSDGNWDKTQYADEWETRRVFNGQRGKCLVRDGRKSPAIKDPKTFWFLSGQKNIDDALVNFPGGENSKEFHTYIIGRLQLHSGGNVAITEADLNSYDCYRNVVWQDAWTDYAGLDPASEGRDGNLMYRSRLGVEANGRTILALIEKRELAVNINKPDKSGQIADQVIEYLEKWNIPLNRLAGDKTGNMGAVFDTIERKYNRKHNTNQSAYRVEASGKCSSESLICEGAKIKKCDRYANRATELYFNNVLACQFRQLVIAFQPTGEKDQEYTHQVTTRQLSQDEEKLRGKVQIEPKKDWRKRNGGKSPDNLDSLSQTLAQVIETGKLKLNEGAANTSNNQRKRSHHRQSQNFMQRKNRRKRILQKY